MSRVWKSLYPVVLFFSGWVFAVLLCSAAAMAEGQTTPTVLDIEVRGNNHISTEVILRRLTNIRLGESLREETVERDTQAIIDLGYFSSVEPCIEPFGSGIRIVFLVHENPLFKEFRLVGLETVAPDELLPYVEYKQGEVVNSVKIIQGFQEAIVKFQEKNGQLLTVDPTQIEISQDGIVTIGLIEVKLGQVIIKGLKKTKEFVVTRELSLTAGDLLNMKMIREDLNSLHRLQIFKDIDLFFQPTRDPGVMDIVLEMTEGELIQFNFGFTYAPKSEELVGFVYIMDPNFRGLGQQISFGVETNPGELSHFNLSFKDPWLDEKNTSFGIRLYSETDYEEVGLSNHAGLSHEYLCDLRHTGVEVSLGRPVKRNLRVNTSFQFERVKTEFKSWMDEENPRLPLETEEYWNNNLGLGLTYDQRRMERLFYTTDGYLAQVNANFYGGFLGGKYDYQKYIGEFRHFFSPWKYTTFGYRVRGGTMIGDVPETDFFQLGGASSIRGYGKEYLQGERLFLSNTELRQRFSKNDKWEFVIFHDLGSVDYEAYYQGYGVGFRYITLLGQLRFDFAWTDQGNAAEPKFHFFVQEMF